MLSNMQSVLFILLISNLLVEAHEDQHHIPSQTVNTIEETENYTSNDPGVELMSSVIQNALNAFGINDTEFRIGQLICPPTNLTSNYKRKTITIGMAGCVIDPLISQYTLEEREALRIHHDVGKLNCSTTVGLAGYLPPIPEHIITMWIRTRDINNDPTILPNHLLCLQLSLSSDITKVLDSIASDVINNGNIPAIVDVSPNSWSTIIQGFVLSHELPTVRYTTGSGTNFATEDDLIQHFQHNNHGLIYDQRSPTVNDLLQKFAKQYFFTIGPDVIIPFKALIDLARVFGWRQIGIIIGYETERELEVHDLYDEEHKIRLVLVHYVEADPYQTFEAIFKSELKILVYQGPPHSFIDVLYNGKMYGFTKNEYVWIVPYYDVAFPEEYVNLWCNYTPEEVYDLKLALRGTLLLGITEGTGQKRDDYLQTFLTEALRITGDDVYEHHRHFIQTAYIHDSLAVVAAALDDLLRDKANRLNVTEDSVEVTIDDRKHLTDKLRNLNFSDGLTGSIRFTDKGHREYSQVDVRNFVPVENENFTVNTSVEEDPWVIQTRACIELKHTGRVNIVYFDENRTTSDTSTIVFRDGTTNIPLDRPFRIFLRSNTRVVITTLTSSLIFLLSVGIFATIIYCEDRRALLYNSNWIHKEEDIDLLSEEQGIKGRLSNAQALRSGYGKENVGKLKHGGIFVSVSKINSKRTTLTNKEYQEANLLMDLKHPNLCLFHGCLLTESYTALLYEYCSRGSLESILLRSDIHFDWVFRLSFALDAAQAMAYLHTKRIVHGALSTGSCMINERWTLKIQDFGLQSIRPTPQQKSQSLKKSLGKKIAPEIRFLGDTCSPAGDVYAYGHILEELSIIRCMPADQSTPARQYSGLADFNRPLIRLSTQSEHQDKDNNHKFTKLQQKCQDDNPQLRPTFEEIKTELRQMSNGGFESALGGQDKGHSRILQAYTHKLEEKVDRLSEILKEEKEHINDFIKNYLPKKLAEEIRKGKKIPLSQELNATILSLEMTNSELLLYNLQPEVAENVILTMKKAIDGVTCSFHVQKLCSTGTSWLLATAMQSDTTSKPILEAVNAAFAILENFSGIFLPGLQEMHPTLRIGIHTGDFICGVVEDPVPQFVAYGNGIKCSKLLTQASKDGCILASEAAAKELEREQGFTATYNKNIEFANTTVATYWIEEDSNTQTGYLVPSNTISNMENEVTIKSRMRKSTVQRFRPSPRSSLASIQQRRRSNPPPQKNSMSNVMVPSPFVTTNAQKSSTVSVLGMISPRPKVGRTWSTMSEPPGMDYELHITQEEKLDVPLLGQSPV